MANYSFVSGGSSNVQSVVDLVEGQLTTHQAWSRTDTVVNGTVTTSVWKCAGTVNSFGQDFYVYLARQTSTPTSFTLSASEGYDAVNKAALRPVAGSNNTSQAPAADFSLGGGTGYALYSAASTFNTAAIYAPSAFVGNAPWSAWTAITSNGIFVWGFNGGATYFAQYAGLFDSFITGEPFPLCVTASMYGATSTVGWSRHPTVTTVNTLNFRCDPPNNKAWTTVTGTLNGSGDRFWNSRPVAARCRMENVGGITVYGQLRGLYKDIVLINHAANTVTMSDSLVIGTDTYVLMGSANPPGSPGLWVNITTP